MFFGFHRAASVWGEYYPSISNPTSYSNQHTQVSGNGNIFVTDSSFNGISQAILVNNGNLLVTDSQFNSCRAESGGGIYSLATSAIFVRLTSYNCSCTSQGAFIYTSSSSNCLTIENSVTSCYGSGYNGIYITLGKQNLTITNFSNTYSLANSAFCLTKANVSFGNISYCNIANCTGNPRVSLIGNVEYRIRCTIFVGNRDPNCIIFEMDKAYLTLENSILINNSANYFANCISGSGGVIYSCYYSNPLISIIGCTINQQLPEMKSEYMSIIENCPTFFEKYSVRISRQMNDEHESFLKILVLSFITGSDGSIEDKSISTQIFLI